MPDLKTFEIALHGDFVNDEPMNVAPQMAIQNSFQKFGDFPFFALNLKFDPTVNQILHRAEHVVPCGDRFDGIPEAHALDASFV